MPRGHTLARIGSWRYTYIVARLTVLGPMKREAEFRAAQSDIALAGGEAIDSANVKQETSLSTPELTTDIAKKHVLIVDDDYAVRTVVERSLALESIPTVCFSNC